MKKLLRFLKKNYFISIILAILLFVGSFSIYKYAFSKSYSVYVKVKLGQGLWWAGGAKPSVWLANAIHKGDSEKTLTGKKIVEILNVTSYPYFGTDQFDVYVTAKLLVGGNLKTKKYTFKRSAIAVGSPIELELSSAVISGTITDISEAPPNEPLIEKTITLTKRNAFPWEFEAIKIGDSFSNGEENLFEIIDKKSTSTSLISTDSLGNSTPQTLEERRFLSVKAKVKLFSIGDLLFFGEDQRLIIGKNLNVSTSNFTFTDYQIANIE